MLLFTRRESDSEWKIMDTSELCMRIKATPNFCWCDGIWTANGSTTTAPKSELQHFFMWSICVSWKGRSSSVRLGNAHHDLKKYLSGYKREKLPPRFKATLRPTTTSFQTKILIISPLEKSTYSPSIYEYLEYQGTCNLCSFYYQSGFT